MIDIPEAVKSLIKSDSVYKNFRVHFPNGERADIINDNIVAESVELGESICSQQTLMFDCCETPTLEFETIGVENIKGAVIECYLEVQCDSSVSGAIQRSDLNNMWVYPIPYGKFVINSCKKQADMTHRKIEAYNYSTYLGGANPIERAKKDENNFYSVIPYHFLVTNNYIEPEEYTQYSYITRTGQTDELGTLILKSRTGLLTYHVSLGFIGVYDTITTEHNHEYLWEIKNTKSSYDAAKDEIAAKLNEWLDTYDLYVDESVSYFTVSNLLKNVDTIITGMSMPIIRSSSNIFYFESYDMYQNEGYVWKISPYSTKTIFIPISARMILTRSGSFVTDASFTILSDYSQCLKKIDVSDKILMASNTSPVAYPMTNFQNVSDLIGSYYELQGKIAKVNRQGKIDAVSIEDSLSNPIETLTASDYESLWYDDDMTKPYGRLICSYKNEYGNDAFINRDIVDDFNEKEYKKYSITNNSLIKNNQFTSAQINAIFDVMEENINDISYMPLDLSMSGRPDIEVGDTLTITTRENESIPCLVMQRSLSGIRQLEDEIAAKEQDEDITSLQLKDSYDSESETLTISIVKS